MINRSPLLFAVLLLALVLAGCGPKEVSTNITPAIPGTVAEAVTTAAVQEAAEPEATAATASEPAVSSEPLAEAETTAPPVEEAESEPLPQLPVETGTTHTVTLIDGGFDVPDITIKAGDTVVWVNEREKRPTKGLVIGTKTCAKLKSPLFEPGSVFKWKFEQKGVCEIVDGIYTTQLMKVIVV